MHELNLYLLEEYKSRINKVMDFIENNLHKPLSLEQLAEIANFSKFHFHRIFAAMMGETIFQFTQRLRLERAAGLLMSNPKIPISQIASDCGFSDQAAFSRAFKLNFGKTPVQWRKEKTIYESNLSKTDVNISQTGSKYNQVKISPSLYLYTINNQNTRRYTMKTPVVRIEELKKSPVAYVRNMGPYKGNPEFFDVLFNKLFSWAGPRGLLNFPETKTIVVYHDNPDITSEEMLRVSACVSIPENTPVDGEVGKMYIAPGKYAMARCEISQSEFQEAWQWVCGEWLPGSGYQPDDAPCFELYQNNFREHPEQKFILDICVPVKPL